MQLHSNQPNDFEAIYTQTQMKEKKKTKKLKDAPDRDFIVALLVYGHLHLVYKHMTSTQTHLWKYILKRENLKCPDCGPEFTYECLILVNLPSFSTWILLSIVQHKCFQPVPKTDLFTVVVHEFHSEEPHITAA